MAVLRARKDQRAPLDRKGTQVQQDLKDHKGLRDRPELQGLKDLKERRGHRALLAQRVLPGPPLRRTSY